MRKLLLGASIVMLVAACQQSLEQKAAQEARMYTQKNCPAQLTETLVMDSMSFDEVTHTLSYYYTFTGAADSVGAINKEEARSNLLTALKNTTSMMAYKEEGYNFAYIYRSQKNPDTILFEAILTKKDYQ